MSPHSNIRKPPLHHSLRNKYFQCPVPCPSTKAGTAICTVSLAARVFKSSPLQYTVQLQPTAAVQPAPEPSLLPASAAALACLAGLGNRSILGVTSSPQRLSSECVSRGAQEASVTVPVTSQRRRTFGQLSLLRQASDCTAHLAPHPGAAREKGRDGAQGGERSLSGLERLTGHVLIAYLTWVGSSHPLCLC